MSKNPKTPPGLVGSHSWSKPRITHLSNGYHITPKLHPPRHHCSRQETRLVRHIIIAWHTKTRRRPIACTTFPRLCLCFTQAYLSFPGYFFFDWKGRYPPIEEEEGTANVRTPYEYDAPPLRCSASSGARLLYSPAITPCEDHPFTRRPFSSLSASSVVCFSLICCWFSSRSAYHL